MAAHDIIMAAAGGSTAATYIEDVFSTWLYTGNDTGSLQSQTLPTGVDVYTYGGFEFVKSRSQNAAGNPTGGAGRWFAASKESGSSNELAFVDGATATTERAYPQTAPTWFLSGGNNFIQGSSINTNGATYASWTFRKQPKFVDVVTWTGNGATTRSIAHALGSTPGCIMVKRTDTSGYNWYVYHRSLGTNGSYPNYLYLNTTDSENGGFYAWFSGAPTVTDFSVGYYSGAGGDTSLNVNGATYVAFVFAHNAGGFGLSGTDNVISCGSYTGTGAANNTITLGYEPQWVLVKESSGTSAGSNNWVMQDMMRGFVANASGGAYLFPNVGNAESTGNIGLRPTATGFATNGGGSSINESGGTYIYIAIRRPMKTPTSGTQVFAPSTYIGDGVIPRTITTGFTTDLVLGRNRLQSGDAVDVDRLRGNFQLYTPSTSAEVASSQLYLGGVQNGYVVNWNGGDGWNTLGESYIRWCFRRAPGFFDEVCFTGRGADAIVNHNLGVAPELIIQKSRTSTSDNHWIVTTVYGLYSGWGDNLIWNNASATSYGSGYIVGTPNATTFTTVLGNYSGIPFVSYLFASCPGVSKVGTYSGTGATQTISCGFAARFVMIKRTDASANWWIWDTSRGMVAGTDPRLPVNLSDPEANANWVYTNASGFQIVTTDATVNASGGSYLYLAIA